MNLPSLVHQPSPTSHPGHGHGHYSNRSPHSSYSPHGGVEYSRAPAPPPSPPVEENTKCSLPSISTLLVYADGGQNGNERAQLQSSQHQHQQFQNQHQQQPPRVTLPPTPPMRPDSVFDGHSPTLSSASSTSPSTYFYPTNTQGHRNSYPPAQKSNVYPSPTEPPYSAQAYYSSSQQQQQQQQQHQQQQYSKQMHQPQLMVPVNVAPPSNSNPWHHHHHTAPSSHAAFPQSQDRYICQTCNKAFSRPSSLRIHSHSHTGEKPFKCPHHGCGKAFSVRSNMKRHERGCHQ